MDGSRSPKERPTEGAVDGGDDSVGPSGEEGVHHSNGLPKTKTVLEVMTVQLVGYCGAVVCVALLYVEYMECIDYRISR